MFVLIRVNSVEVDSNLREQARAKIEASLAKFGHRVVKVKAFLSDLNGPKKGIDKLMRLVIEVKSRPSIIIEEKAKDWGALLELAVDRASQIVARKCKRHASGRRGLSVDSANGGFGRQTRWME